MSIKKIIAPGTMLNIVQTNEDFRVPNAFPRPDVIIATKSGITITLPSNKDIGTSIKVVADTPHRIFINTDPTGRASGGNVGQGPNPKVLHGGASATFTSTPNRGWFQDHPDSVPSRGPAGPMGPAGQNALIQTGFNQLDTNLHFTSNFFASILSIIGNFTPENFVEVIANFSCVSNDQALPSIIAPTIADFELSVANGAGPDVTLAATGTELTFIALNSGVTGTLVFRFQVMAPNPHTIKLLARIRTAPRSFNINAATEPSRQHASLSFLETTA
jgi:hypothetical protein